MVNVAQVEAFPVLPEEATSDVPNGKYVVATTDEVIHEAEDDQIVYQPWLKTHVRYPFDCTLSTKTSLLLSLLTLRARVGFRQ